jgi:hypothetical protein
MKSVWSAALCSMLLIPAAEAAPQKSDDLHRSETMSAAYAALPLSFEPNLGQVGAGARYLSRGEGYVLGLTSQEAIFHLRQLTAKPEDGPAAGGVLRMQLVGASTDAVGEGLDPLPGRSHYLRGSDPGKWQLGVPN